MIETFDKLIVEYFTDKNSIPQFVRTFYDPEQYDTKVRSLRRYIAGDVVPQYSVARDIIDKLGIEISEDDLMVILDYSKSERETNIKYKESSLIEKLTIKYNDIFPDRDISMYEKDQMIKERIDAVCKRNSIKEYVIKLIENDVENWTLDNWEPVPKNNMEDK